MTPAEQAHTAEQRKLIVANLVNGVELPDVATAFRCSKEEVMRAFDLALRKIRSYCFERRLPAFVCNGVGDARNDKQVFLHFLDRINLATDPKFRRIGGVELTEDNLRRI